jgi:hypothetical protein
VVNACGELMRVGFANGALVVSNVRQRKIFLRVKN